MSNQNGEDFVVIEYKIEKNEKKIKIFHEKFVKTNKQFCKILYRDEEYELKEYIEINKDDFNKDFLSIKLKGINNIIDASYMFSECNSLMSSSDLSIWNTSNLQCIDRMFYGCISLKSLPDISKWNTSKIFSMNYMFGKCRSIISLPDISIWDTSYLMTIEGMFDECISLINVNH